MLKQLKFKFLTKVIFNLKTRSNFNFKIRKFYFILKVPELNLFE